jgi:hypothetical protein
VKGKNKPDGRTTIGQNLLPALAAEEIDLALNIYYYEQVGERKANA